MGRKAEGLKLVERDGYWYARFTWAKQRHFISTGESDRRRAQVEAERIYGEIVSGRRRKVSAAVRVSAPLLELFADWLGTLEGVLDAQTLKTYRTTYVGRHFLDFFGKLDDVADESQVDAYARARLRKVLRSTVHKELGALRGFLRWAKMEGFITAIPTFPEFPKTAKGKRSGAQRAKANELTEAQVLAAIQALPAISSRISKKDRKRFAVRARFVVAYETGLRPATLDALVLGKHWSPANGFLLIPDEDDKSRYGRSVSLTDGAQQALHETVRALGLRDGDLIFGAHDYRTYLKAAGGVALVKKLAPYDFRHARGTHLANRGAALPGIAYQLGHTQLTTTNKYAHATKAAGDLALTAGGALDEKGTSDD
jgi:integrase